MLQKYFYWAVSMLLLISACAVNDVKTTPTPVPIPSSSGNNPPPSSGASSESTPSISTPLPISATNSTLHAVLLADTNDETIGRSVKVDLEKVTNLLPSIGKNTGMKIKAQSISGDQLTRRNVTNALNQLSVKPDDAVIFYYSGHGGRMSSKKTKWPSLFIGGSLLDFDWIISTLERKNPRFFMAISDSCNNILDYSSGRSHIGKPKPENYQQLFLKYRGSVIASSSSPGEYSWGTPRNGGLFTLTFLNSLNKELGSSNPNWQNIMRRAEKPIKVRQYVQKPQYDIQLKPVTQPDIIPSTEKTPNKSLSIQVLPSRRFRVNEQMRVKIDSQKTGYLFVWDIGSKGGLSRLFPNPYVKHNQIQSGKTVFIPESLSDFSLTVGEPIGTSVLVALLVDKAKVRKVQPEQLESIAAPNAQTALQQLLKQLDNKLGQGGWEIDRVEYEIRR